MKGMLSVTVIVIGNGIRGPKVKSMMRLLKGMLSVTVSVTVQQSLDLESGHPRSNPG